MPMPCADRVSHRVSRRALMTSALAAGSFPSLAFAKSPPILTVISPNQTRQRYDETALAALPWHDIVTHTVWTEGPQRFRGPLLRDILVQTGATAFDLAQRRLTLTALNDFVVDIPASDAFAFDAMLARTANGQPMAVRDKGPLWLVYPRDTTPVLQTPDFDERWVWQLTLIEIR